MSKLFICLSVIFSLLLAPIAHAAETGCIDGNGKNFAKVEILKKSSQDNQQDNDKSENPDHFCCSHIVSDRTPPTMPNAVVTASTVAIPSEDDFIPFLGYGPLLKPPSHA